MQHYFALSCIQYNAARTRLLYDPPIEAKVVAVAAIHFFIEQVNSAEVTRLPVSIQLQLYHYLKIIILVIIIQTQLQLEGHKQRIIFFI